MKTLKDIQDQYDKLLKQKQLIEQEIFMLHGEARLLREIEETNNVAKKTNNVAKKKNNK